MEVRLQKYLARCGVASRRASEDLIRAGRVRVNGLVADLGSKVEPGVDEVTVDGKRIEGFFEHVTLMLHKPAGYVTSMKDEHANHLVSELVPEKEYPGLYPIGRLDQDTTGLLLFSTDGELGHALLRPKNHVPKTYIALVDGQISDSELTPLRTGILLDDGMTLPAEAKIVRGVEEQKARKLFEVSQTASMHTGKGMAAKKGNSEQSVVCLVLHEGKKRQVKRMLSAIGHPVLALHRESFGCLTLGSLPRGSWRLLSDQEVALLWSYMQ